MLLVYSFLNIHACVWIYTFLGQFVRNILFTTCAGVLQGSNEHAVYIYIVVQHHDYSEANRYADVLAEKSKDRTQRTIT